MLTVVPGHLLNNGIDLETISLLETAVGPKRPFSNNYRPIRPTGPSVRAARSPSDQNATHQILERSEHFPCIITCEKDFR